MIRENDLLIVDGLQGVLIVAPDPAVLGEYQLRQSQLGLERQKLRRLRSTPAITLDGAQIELYANIELPQDVEDAREAGAQGIGLFRTEFLFMNRRNLPTEDEQFEAYRTVVVAMRGLPVTIRTLDISADKGSTGRVTDAQSALGLRAIRFSLPNRVFLTQLRAICAPRRSDTCGCWSRCFHTRTKRAELVLHEPRPRSRRPYVAASRSAA